MPALGADMTSGTLLEWRVKPGDAVKRGDIVAVVDTSKAEIEVEIFEDGVIDELLVAEGAKVPVGTALATVRAGAEAGAQPPQAAAPPPAEAAEAGTPPIPPAGPAETPPPPSPSPPPAPAPVPPPPAFSTPPHEHRLRVSPLARRAAEELGVDLAAVAGSGPGGAITRDDVERAAAGGTVERGEPAPAAPASAAPGPSASGAPATSPAAPAAEPGDRALAMRQAIGALMARSKREIPHYYLQTQIDMSRALAWLAEENLRRPMAERLLPSALLLRATAKATAATPALNGFWVDEAFHPGEGVHLGVAISLRGGGLIAPALHDADRMTVDEVMAGLRDLVARARAGRLRGSEMSDPTITVTNLGEQGVDLVHGVIYPPQVALVGFGAVRERPWAVDGMIGVRPIVTATLAADHRASDGHAGGRFLTLIDHELQRPEEL
jgi:pyruvate dehydrogenase E2 component (dihydrolipoamide acetyltransferase)